LQCVDADFWTAAQDFFEGGLINTNNIVHTILKVLLIIIIVVVSIIVIFFILKLLIILFKNIGKNKNK